MKKEFSFQAHPEKEDVSACFLRPSKPDAVLVIGHGAGAGMYHTNMESIVTVLHKRNIATLRYQFPFMERGGGRDSQAVSLATVESAVAQARKLMNRSKNLKELPILAGGHSFGGRMTSLAAAEQRLGDVSGLIYFAFPLHAPGRPSNDRAAHLAEIKQPMLFLSGTRDKLMDLDQFQPVLKKIKKRSKLHLLNTADHGYKTLKKVRPAEDDVFEEMGSVVQNWLVSQKLVDGKNRN